MKFILDRIDGNIAVFEAEDLSVSEADISRIKPNAIVGGSFKKQGDYFILDLEDTAKRKKRISEKMKKIFK